MSDKLYINENECVIYRDSKLHSIVKLTEIDEELLKTLKLIFPDSDINILGFEKLNNGLVPETIEVKEDEF